MARQREQGEFPKRVVKRVGKRADKRDEVWDDAPTVRLVVEEVMVGSEGKKPRVGVAARPVGESAVAKRRGAAEKIQTGKGLTRKSEAGKRARGPKEIEIAMAVESGAESGAESDVEADRVIAQKPAPAAAARAKSRGRAKKKSAEDLGLDAVAGLDAGSGMDAAASSGLPMGEALVVAQAETAAELAAETAAGRDAVSAAVPEAELEAELEVDSDEAAKEADSESEAVGERLQKLLARAGVASRRRAEKLIAEGRVQVNGQVVTEPGTRAVMGRDHVRVDGKLIQAAERMRYFVLNKPKGYVTTVSDPEGRPTVMEFFRGVRERVYPVGRLDYLSEGLLVMTNDGQLANGLTRAAHGVEKRYLVKVAGEPTEAELDRLRGGVVIERGRPGSGEGRVRTAPAQIRKVREGDNPWFEVVLIEGRNRELRKMFEEIGHHVEKIRRVGYGPLELDVEPGKLRELDEDELRLLRLASEGKWKPKRKRKPIALPKEAGRKVEHGSGSGRSGGFAGRSAGRTAGAGRPAGRGAGFGTGRGAGFGAARGAEGGSEFERGSAARPTARRWDGEGRKTDRGTGSGSQRTFSRRAGDGGSGSAKSGPGKSRFAKPEFGKAGFGRSGEGRPGSGSRGAGSGSGAGSGRVSGRDSGREFRGGAAFGAGRSGGRWQAEDEKPQPGGRNSTPRLGADGKPRKKKRWRDAFEGKSKGKPKWSGKPKGK